MYDNICMPKHDVLVKATVPITPSGLETPRKRTNHDSSLRSSLSLSLKGGAHLMPTKALEAATHSFHGCNDGYQEVGAMMDTRMWMREQAMRQLLF